MYTDPTGHYCETIGADTAACAYAEPSIPTNELPNDPRDSHLSTYPIIPIYSAKEGVQPGVSNRSSDQIQQGKALSTVGTAVDIFATALSGSYTAVQLTSYGAFGPTGLDDVAVTIAYPAIDVIENTLSKISAITVMAADYLTGASDISEDGVIIGQDTLFIGATAYVGEWVGITPVAGPSLDTVVNLAVNYYDLGRLSGSIPTRVEGRWDENGVYLLIFPPPKEE